MWINNAADILMAKMMISPRLIAWPEKIKICIFFFRFFFHSCNLSDLCCLASLFFFGNFAWRKDRRAAAMGCFAYEMSNCNLNQFQIMLSRFYIHLSFTWLHEITDNWVDAVGTQMKTLGEFFSSFLLLFSVIFSSKKWSSYKLSYKTT